MKLINHLTIFLFIPFSLIFAGQLKNAKTVFIIEQGLAGIEVDQKTLVTPESDFLMIRDQRLILSVSSKTEIGFNIPQIEYYSDQNNYSKIGDVKIYMNTTTSLLQSFMLTNFYLEVNTASGPKYDDLNNHPMEAYGYNEYRWGFIFFKKRRYFSIHGNLFYVFKSQSESSFTNGMTINILEKETYNRAFGFNPLYKDNFFYKGNFNNDNLEYAIAINTSLPYPFVPFVEYVFAHDFQRSNHVFVYDQRRPGSGMINSVFTAGTKVFFSENNFSIKFCISIPTEPVFSLYNTDISLGARLDF